MAPGFGLIKSSKAGKGLRSRWYPKTLKKRILNTVSLRQHITFLHSDGLTTMRQYAERADCTFLLTLHTDPPRNAQVAAYTLPDVDHRSVFRIADAVAGNVLIT